MVWYYSTERLESLVDIKGSHLVLFREKLDAVRAFFRVVSDRVRCWLPQSVPESGKSIPISNEGWICSIFLLW